MEADLMEADLVNLSASSLPGIPLCPGIQTSETLQSKEDKVASRFLIRKMRWDLIVFGVADETVSKTLSESVKIAIF